MKKIISLFQRNYEGDHLVRNEVTPGAEWVIAGEGFATRKWDGTCCLIRGGILYKRYDAKAFTVNEATGGQHAYKRSPPAGFEPAQEPDPKTGHWPGWVPVRDSNPEDRWHIEAWDQGHAILDPVDGPAMLMLDVGFKDGKTYELVGDRVQGNPEHVVRTNGHGHWLVPHGEYFIGENPREFDAICEFLRTADIEGIVWHRENGDMVKIKTRDFGLTRK